MSHRPAAQLAFQAGSLHEAIADTWSCLQSARSTADASWELLEQLRSASRAVRQVPWSELVALGAPVPPVEPTRSEPDPSAPSRADASVPIEAWLELGDGSAEQSAVIREAVGEIVQLQFLFIEALCRHFPALGSEIRSVAQHLFEDATRLVDPSCCQPSEGPPRRPLERMN